MHVHEDKMNKTGYFLQCFLRPYVYVKMYYTDLYNPMPMIARLLRKRRQRLVQISLQPFSSKSRPLAPEKSVIPHPSARDTTTSVGSIPFLGECLVMVGKLAIPNKILSPI